MVELIKNKLFNYLLQAVETEFSVKKLYEIQQLLEKTKTCLILYTYDSLLFDIPVTEAKIILPKIKQVLETGKFPVKCKVGNIYSKMNDIKY